ncbi:MAG TPA: hypothetical protein VJ455_02615 [Ignavibacteria bacterium]|nr:hypothetical protein [Ignavibacteria bacterium]
MIDTVIKYVQPVILLAVFFIILLKSCNDNENIEKNFRRDAMLELKIDSVKSTIIDVDNKLMLIDLSLNESSSRIKINKTKYEENKNVIINKPADSVYNWTRGRLSKRSE